MAVSNVHLQPVLREAKRKGARVLLVDPVRHKSEKLADRMILPRPGGDFDLAMGVAARLFATRATDPGAPAYCDHFDAFRALALSRSVEGWAAAAGVSPDDVAALASALAERPCSIQVGWGMGRRMNGSAIVRALDALGAVSGNLGIPGGGVSFYFKRRGAFDTSFLKKNPPRAIPEPLLGEGILAAQDPPIRAVWVTAGNPVSMLPDSATVAKALETRELVVVVDPFLTDTARRATVVFPTTTLVEDDDVLGAYGNHWLGASTPVVAAARRRPDGPPDRSGARPRHRRKDRRARREDFFEGKRDRRRSGNGSYSHAWKPRASSWSSSSVPPFVTHSWERSSSQIANSPRPPAK